MINLFKKTKDSFLQLVDQLKLRPGDCYFGTTQREPVGNVVSQLTQEPHSLFLGAMGSGKSCSAVSSILSYTLANPQDLILVVDSLKGANDFLPLFSYQRVMPFVNDERYVKGCIELLYEEIKSRQGLFQSIGVSNINDYNKKVSTYLSKVIFVWEEAHVLNQILNYDTDHNKPGTYAGKFKTIMRIGRSYGVTVCLITQICTPSYISSGVVISISNICAFKTSQVDANYVNIPEAANLQFQDKGVAITKSGRVQFPYISTDKAKEYVSNDKKQKDLIPNLSSVSQVGLHQLKQNPANILSPKFYRTITMLDEAEVIEDLEFWEFVEKGPKVVK